MQEELHITDLIDVDILQQVQNAFSKLTGIASLTTDANGIAVTEGTNFTEFCMKYTRKSTLGCLRCEQCDKYGAETAVKNGATTAYHCHAGLLDFAAPIMAGNRMIGCFIGGQVLTEAPQMSKIMETARGINVDPITYWNAAKDIKIVSKEALGTTADFLQTIAGVLSNIAQHKLMINQANIEVEKAARMKSDFLANMSHEIRTPLNAILGFSRIIAETENAEERLQYYDIVEKNNMRLQELINEILDLSKIESGMMEFNYAPVSLYTLCEDVKNTYSFRCQPGVELVFEESDPSLVISTDRNRLFQVFSNLIGNATKFTAKGSISFGYKLTEKEIVFHIADTGSGISDDKIDKIFDRFIMANNQVQGTGLGLSISKIIVEKLGGKIAVQSKMETGTTFTFTLPYISANGDMKWEEKLPPASVKDNSRTSHQEMTILVAEDYQSNYDLIEAMIGKIYKLVHAHDGMEAIIFYEQYKPDLILMDIKMPNINGLDATRAIREMSADVPVIAVSAYAYEKDKIAAIESGCNDFLTKPVSADLLKMTINKYLKQK